MFSTGLIPDNLGRAEGRQFLLCGVFRRFAEPCTAGGETTNDALVIDEAEIATLDPARPTSAPVMMRRWISPVPT